MHRSGEYDNMRVLPSKKHRSAAHDAEEQANAGQQNAVGLADATMGDSLPPHGHTCAQCGSPVDDDDRFCNACGSAQALSERQAAPATHSIECKNCGAMLNAPADERSITCPFCDSNYVVDRPAEVSGRQLPEFVLGFALTPDEALAKFRQWLRAGGWFHPGDLERANIEGKLRGVYLPFWSFSMLARSGWSATIGEYWYRTETYTTTVNGKRVTRTRRVRETEWWPLSGKHHRYYFGYLVSGSNSLPQRYADGIKPFRLEALKRYQPYFLAGWLSEEYTVERDEALVTCQNEFQSQERSNIAAFLPGDTHRSLEVRTSYSNISSDLILLPVYLLSYRYGDKLFRFVLNGQTGKAMGDRPLSAWRIGGVAAAVIVAILLVILFIVLNR